MYTFLVKSFFTTVSAMVIACALAVPARAGPQKPCDEVGDQFLLHPTPKSWGSLHRLFKQIGRCDDGALGEGFSDDVAQLFIKQWAHLDELKHLMASDRSFAQFVFRHIDATLSEEELRAVEENSKSRCPSGDAQLCQTIGTLARKSLEELPK